MIVSDLLQYIRIEVGDEDKKSRWSDEKLLSYVKRAFFRTNNLIRRNGIELGKSLYEFETASGQQDYDLPYDFMVPISVFKESQELTHRTIEQFNSIYYANECTNYIIQGDKILILGIPSTEVTLRLFYYTLFQPEELTIESETPYEGKLDMIIVEYIATRLRNTNENEISADLEFFKDMEEAILSTYATIDPIVIESRGWM